MRANISLEKSLTNKAYYLVINEECYVKISKEMFYGLADYLGIDVGD